jgi:AraC-like DNA-binding protein
MIPHEIFELFMSTACAKETNIAIGRTRVFIVPIQDLLQITYGKLTKMQIWETPPVVRLAASNGRQGSRSRTTFSGTQHDHPFYEFGIVLAGQCDWHLGRRRLTLRAGEAILLKPKTFHREDTRPGCHSQLAWVGFDFKGEAPLWANRAVSTEEDFSEIAGYIEIIAREHHQPGRSFAMRVGLAAQSLLLLVARRAEIDENTTAAAPKSKSTLNPRQMNRVESAAHYFRTNLRDALSIAQVAAYHSLCPAHFSSLFRRHHHVSPRGFLHQVRLDKAGEMLETSDLTVKEIAAQCGFVDAAHLCKAFKVARGLTPRQFRTRSVSPI